MRAPLLVVLFLTAEFSGCTARDCLPENESDTTPPDLRLTIEYTEAKTGGRIRAVITDRDSAQTLVAAPGSEVVITYEGTDEQGIRRIHLGLTRQNTVGVGIQTEYIPQDPVIARCPVARLSGKRTVFMGRGKNSLSIGLIAESWSGVRAGMPTHIIAVGGN